MRRPRSLASVRFLLAPLIVWILYLVKANVWFRLYPAVIVSVVLSAFAVSLFRRPLAEVFARRMGAKLDERGIAYCRTVTWVWTAFLAAHLAVTVATVFASPEVWAFYNGFLAYVLIGSLFLAEWLYRRRVVPTG